MTTREQTHVRRSKQSSRNRRKHHTSQSDQQNPQPAQPAQQTQPAADSAPKTFAELGLGNRALEAVNRAGFTEPTDIQQKFIPAALSGRDSVGLARTGTGKTAAFLLPLFEQMNRGERVKALVLAPTRELAVQIAEEGQKLAGKGGPKVVVVYGGANIKHQIHQLKAGADIVVATPGRLLDHAQRRTIDFKSFTAVVLDEVDRMFDMGFRQDITRIMRGCASRKQTFFLSATMPQDIMGFADRFLTNPTRVSAIDEDGPSVEQLEQRYFAIAPQRKRQLLAEILHRERPELCLIFTRTKRGAERLGKDLKQKGFNVAHIHGDLSQNQRDRAMNHFRERKVQILVATDVMGRGIDVPGISHVINYDIPENPKDYLHRIGRSGRMHASGKAFTFVTPEQAQEITAIEMTCNRLLDKDQIQGFDNGVRPRR